MPAKGGRYHHGDLRPALVDAAIDVIAERGVRGFSLAEASRRLGVTTAAPYRHFADRDELLATVAVRALSVFAAMLADAADAAAAPAQRLAAMAGAYVRFAAQQRPLFDTIYNSGLDKSRYPVRFGRLVQWRRRISLPGRTWLGAHTDRYTGSK